MKVDVREFRELNKLDRIACLEYEIQRKLNFRILIIWFNAAKKF